MLSDAEARQALETMADTIRACALCRLASGRRCAVPGEGPVRAAILLVGEAPGRDEDASGQPFVGRAGRVLDSALAAAQLPRDSVFITNVVKCRPPGNRRPKPDEVAACRPYLVGQIAFVRPRAIVTLGATALRALLGPGHELKESRGKPLRFGGIPVVATYHPAGVLYNRALEARLRRDLRKVAGPTPSSVRGPRRHEPSGRRRGPARAARRSRRPRR